MTDGKADRGVLLVSVDGPASRSLMHAMQAAMLEIEWARSLSELEHQKARAAARSPALVFVDLELPDAAADDLVSLVRSSFPRALTVALAAEPSGDTAAMLLSQGVPSLVKPVSPDTLTGLALRLSLGADRAWSSGASPPGQRLESLIDAYAADRLLSKQQRMILRLYLEGRSDKEIAGLCSCSETTVYEHWRRMARKVGGALKSDAIADFHRYLACV